MGEKRRVEVIMKRVNWLWAFVLVALAMDSNVAGVASAMAVGEASPVVTNARNPHNPQGLFQSIAKAWRTRRSHVLAQDDTVSVAGVDTGLTTMMLIIIAVGVVVVAIMIVIVAVHRNKPGEQPKIVEEILEDNED